MSHKITYYDLKDEKAAGRLPRIVGRREEMYALDRILGRRINNNAIITGPAGIGKTTLAHGWARARNADQPVFQLEADHVHTLEADAILAALDTLPSCTLFIDDLGREMYKNLALAQEVFRLYKTLLYRADVQVVVAMQPYEYAWLERELPAFLHPFETLSLKEQPINEQLRILTNVLPLINKKRLLVADARLREMVEYATRFPALGQLPRSAIVLLDEALAQAARERASSLTSETIARLVEEKTKVPKAQLERQHLSNIRNLQETIQTRVLHQDTAIKTIATTLQRAKLGLRNQGRPLGSFLMLGPSGVGKTETAKAVADTLFGETGSFVRFDMSEFQQEHTVQRLIGAPAGYVGFEAGGALTNALKKNPYSLILLDEIEKAHPKVFDIFLQLLDEGRLTSGQNETIDATHAVIMATSNAAVPEILAACSTGKKVGDEHFVREIALPILARTFRLEFLNRFDNVVVFQPLPAGALMDIAQLEMRKTEQRLAAHRVRFTFDQHVLAKHIKQLADPRFGARPIKRFIEETCETLVAEALLSKI
jgi:ATP-dependent Clp protease ATP-binding subunit ClpA